MSERAVIRASATDFGLNETARLYLLSRSQAGKDIKN